MAIDGLVTIDHFVDVIICGIVGAFDDCICSCSELLLSNLPKSTAILHRLIVQLHLSAAKRNEHHKGRVAEFSLGGRG